MGGELLLFSYIAGLAPLAFGLYVTVAGRVYLTAGSREPIRGAKARWLGCFCILAAVGYYATITRAWSVYDR